MIIKKTAPIFGKKRDFAEHQPAFSNTHHYKDGWNEYGAFGDQPARLIKDAVNVAKNSTAWIIQKGLHWAFVVYLRTDDFHTHGEEAGLRKQNSVNIGFVKNFSTLEDAKAYCECKNAKAGA